MRCLNCDDGEKKKKQSKIQTLPLAQQRCVIAQVDKSRL